MHTSRSDRLSLAEVARRCRVSEGTIRRWVRQGTIPSHEDDSGLFFLESELSRWAKARGITFCIPSPTEPEPSLAEALARGVVGEVNGGGGVEEVLEEVVNRLKLPEGTERSWLLERLIEREQLASTGIGKGVAIPHPREPLSNLEAPEVSCFFLRQPVEYSAVDGIDVFVVFVMLSPSARVHLRLLSKLGFLLRDQEFVQLLHTRPGRDELVKEIATREQALMAASRRR